MVLDEPFASVDAMVKMDILHLLEELRVSYPMTYLLISHDVELVRSISHHVSVMKDGSIVESGEAAQVCDRPQHLYTKKLLNAARLTNG
jgi:microcin C transport system ATP-binding protein